MTDKKKDAEPAPEPAWYDQPKGVYQKIAYIMRLVETVPRLGYNEHHRYHYVREEDLTAHIRPKMAEIGLLLLPSVRSSEQAGNVTMLDVEYTFVDVETGEKHAFRVVGHGQDSQDKGPYKAMTGCQKYALMKPLLVSTGEDPESSEGGPPRQQPQPGRKKKAPRRPEPPPPPSNAPPPERPIAGAKKIAELEAAAGLCSDDTKQRTLGWIDKRRNENRPIFVDEIDSLLGTLREEANDMAAAAAGEA